MAVADLLDPALQRVARHVRKAHGDIRREGDAYRVRYTLSPNTPDAYD